MKENTNRVASAIINIEKRVERLDDMMCWLFKEAKAGRLGGGGQRFAKPTLEWETIAEDYEGPFAGFSKSTYSDSFSIVCPKVLIENPHGEVADEDDSIYLVVPLRTMAQGEMYYIGVAKDEERDWREGKYDNDGDEVTFCEDYKRLKTGKQKAPLTQDEKEVKALQEEWDAAEDIPEDEDEKPF